MIITAIINDFVIFIIKKYFIYTSDVNGYFVGIKVL